MMENSEINQQLANAKLVQCKTYATPRAHLTSSHVQNGGLGKKEKSSLSRHYCSSS